MAKVQGLERLNRKLQRLKTLTVPSVAPAMEQGGDIVVREQQRLAPVGRTGELRDSIGWEWIDRARLKLRVICRSFKGRWVEFGTAPHKIEAEPGKALGPGGIFGSEVDHPGATAHPFFFPGYRAVRKLVLRLIARAIRKAVKEAVR